MLGGGGGSDWTASTLLVNLFIFRTRFNSKTCAYILTNDCAQLILARTCSIMPGSSALTRIFAYSHIFASSLHLTIIFTYLETPSSPLSYYVRFILLCCPFVVEPDTMCGIVDAGAYELRAFILPPTPWHAATHCRRRETWCFRSLMTMWHTDHSLCCLGQRFHPFFVVWWNSRTTIKYRYLAAIPRQIHDR